MPLACCYCCMSRLSLSPLHEFPGIDNLQIFPGGEDFIATLLLSAMQSLMSCWLFSRFRTPLLTSGAGIFESRNIRGGRDGGSVVGVGVVVSVALDDDVVLVKVAVRGVEIVVVHAERVEGSHFSRG
ncbi:hypothetical protein TB2_007754 [Malus domestica]